MRTESFHLEIYFYHPELGDNNDIGILYSRLIGGKCPKLCRRLSRMIGVFIYVVFLYLAIGLVVSVPFALIWSKRIEPAVQSSTLGFKLIVVPGAAMLWPYMLVRIRRA